MNIFVLAIILAAVNQESIVLPLLAYETKEVCEQKIKMLEEKFVFKNPVTEFECFSSDKFKGEGEKQGEEEKPKEGI